MTTHPTWLRALSERIGSLGRILVASGVGAGVGAIFRAPLGGAVLAAEIPYRDDTESEALVPSFVASMVAFATFGWLVGASPIFGSIEATFEEPGGLRRATCAV